MERPGQFSDPEKWDLGSATTSRPGMPPARPPSASPDYGPNWVSSWERLYLSSTRGCRRERRREVRRVGPPLEGEGPLGPRGDGEGVSSDTQPPPGRGSMRSTPREGARTEAAEGPPPGERDQGPERRRSRANETSVVQAEIRATVESLADQVRGMEEAIGRVSAVQAEVTAWTRSLVDQVRTMAGGIARMHRQCAALALEGPPTARGREDATTGGAPRRRGGRPH